MSVHGSSRAMALAVTSLQVNPQRMRANLDALRVSLSKAAAEEWFHPDLAQHAARMARSQLAALRGQGLPC